MTLNRSVATVFREDPVMPLFYSRFNVGIKGKIMIHLLTDFSRDITWLVLTFHNVLSS